MSKGALRRHDIVLPASPRLLWRRLQRAAIGKREFPGQGTHLVHRIKMRRRFLVRLATRQERDTSNGGGDRVI